MFGPTRPNIERIFQQTRRHGKNTRGSPVEYTYLEIVLKW